jgi:hypothetical protein
MLQELWLVKDICFKSRDWSHLRRFQWLDVILGSMLSSQLDGDNMYHPP